MDAKRNLGLGQPSSEHFFEDPRGRVAGLEWQCQNLAAGGLHLFTAGDEMRPVSALDQDIGEHGGDELARGVFVEECDRIDGLERGGEFRAFVLGNERPVGSFEALHARVGVQGKNQNVAERAGAFEKPDVAGMEDIVAAVGEDDLLTCQLPGGASGDQLVASVDRAQRVILNYVLQNEEACYNNGVDMHTINLCKVGGSVMLAVPRLCLRSCTCGPEPRSI